MLLRIVSPATTIARPVTGWSIALIPKGLLLIVCGVAAFAVRANDVVQPAAEALTKATSAADEWIAKYYPYEERVSGWVNNTARGIDSFFGSDDAWTTDNKSFLRITSDMRWDQIDQGTVELRPRLRLDLPTASKRLRLLFENDSPEERTAAQEAVPNLRNTGGERRAVFGLGTGLDKWAPIWRKSLSAGVRAALPIEPYVRFVARRKWSLGGEWELNSYNRFAWFEQDGYSAKAEIKFGQPLAPRWRIDFPTDLAWRQDRDYLEAVQSASLTNILDTRSAISYTTGVTVNSLHDSHVEGYFISADYRRNIARRIVFIDLIPVVVFRREDDFDARAGITFRLELYFQKFVDD